MWPVYGGTGHQGPPGAPVPGGEAGEEERPTGEAAWSLSRGASVTHPLPEAPLPYTNISPTALGLFIFRNFLRQSSNEKNHYTVYTGCEIATGMVFTTYPFSILLELIGPQADFPQTCCTTCQMNVTDRTTV